MSVKLLERAMVTYKSINGSKSSVKYLHTAIFSERTDLTKAVEAAEKIVGYPSSFLNLRWLINDEMSEMSLHLKKLIGTSHPLVKNARKVILNKQLPSWGLIVLLVSKAGGLGRDFPEIDFDATAGVLHSQRTLAEVTEMIRTSNLLHKNIQNISEDDAQADDVNFGNKLSLLIGDYIISNYFQQLAELKCHEVTEMIAVCLRNLAEAGFIEPCDSHNRPLPAKPLGKQAQEIEVPYQFEDNVLQLSDLSGNAKAEWTSKHLLKGACVLAKCCQATLFLADHPKSVQQTAHLLGRNIALAWQAHQDLLAFKNNETDPFSLIAAPLLFHLEHEVSYYDKLMMDVEKEQVNYREIKEIVNGGPGMDRTEELYDELRTNALWTMDEFPDSEAKSALENIIKSL